MNRNALGLPIFELEVSDAIYEGKLRGAEEQIKSQLYDLNVGINFVKESGKIVRVEVYAIHKEMAEAVHDILARIQDTLIHIGHEEEDEITEEISTIRSKYSKRKTTAFKRGLLELLHGPGEGKDQGKDEGKNSKEWENQQETPSIISINIQ